MGAARAQEEGFVCCFDYCQAGGPDRVKHARQQLQGAVQREYRGEEALGRRHYGNQVATCHAKEGEGLAARASEEDESPADVTDVWTGWRHRMVIEQITTRVRLVRIK